MPNTALSSRVNRFSMPASRIVRCVAVSRSRRNAIAPQVEQLSVGTETALDEHHLAARVPRQRGRSAGAVCGRTDEGARQQSLPFERNTGLRQRVVGGTGVVLQQFLQL